MKNDRIFVLTGSDGFWGQGLYPWESLKKDRIIEIFEENDFEVIECTFNQVANKEVELSNSIVLYSSSQRYFYKEYIEDVLIYLYQKNNLLIPSINILKSHENKGYQELYKSLLGLESLKSFYMTTDEISDDNTLRALNFPVVFKYISGAGSLGVHLVNCKKELLKLANKPQSLDVNKLKYYVKEKIKKYFYPTKYDPRREKYYKSKNRFLIQEYIPNLKYDYKVLVFNTKYYVLKRYTKENDFKASGSGIFKFEKVQTELLDFSKKIFEAFKEPVMSLDICFDGNKYYLLEFQGTHFGPFTIMASDGYYVIENESWKFTSKKSELEKEFACAIINYIQQKK